MKPIVLDGAELSEIPSANALELRAATTGNASLNLPHGTAPTSPNNGDVWTTSGGIYVRINGMTIGPLSASGGGGGGGSQLLATYTPSGATSLDIEDFVGLGHNKIRLECDLAFGTDGVGLSVQFKLNGSYQSGANSYRSAGMKAASSTASNDSGEVLGTSGKLPIAGGTWGIGNAVDENYSGTLTVNNAGSSRNKRMVATASYGAPSGSSIALIGSVTYEGTDKGSVLQGIRLAPTSGTFTGEVRVYGED